jgi:HEAT repeat protein
MTSQPNDPNGRSHRRPKSQAGEADDLQPNVTPNADDLADDELLAAAIFAEDALSGEMLIGSPAELDDLEDETLVNPVAAARARLTVDALLSRLVNQAEEVTLRDLFVLSDISRAEADAVAALWPTIPVARRRRLVNELVVAAEETIELLLGRLLRIGLHDDDAEVRRLAIDGLWEDEDPALIGAYVHMLNNDPDSSVRAAAAGALGPFVLAGELDELDSAMAMRAEEALLAIVHSSLEPIEVQARALESVAYSGEAGLRQLIEDAYYAPEEEMRLSALRAMGRSADTRWRSLVRAELTSPDAAMRLEAALAAGELEIKSAAPQLIAMLADDELGVRLAAIDALGHLGGKAARDALRTLADEGEPEEAEAAEIALDEMLFYAEPGALPLLEEDDEDLDDLDDLDVIGKGFASDDDDDDDDDDNDDNDDDDNDDDDDDDDDDRDLWQRARDDWDA